MTHLMRQHRTYACVYNIQSWCTYVSSTHACYAQDLAPEAHTHKACLEYRELEVALYRALDSSKKSPARFSTLASLLAAKRKALLGQVKACNVTVCAFYPEYSSHDHKATVNRTDPNIPRLISRGEVTIKGQPSSTGSFSV